MIFNKHFTLAQAREQLPLVKSIVADILASGKAMKQILANHPDQGLPIPARRIIEEIETLMAELERMGCYYKDWNFEIGLVDFPAIVEGQEVLLCWRSDEIDISWYHGADDGYANRKPLPITWLVS